jgi:cell division protein FtsB
MDGRELKNQAQAYLDKAAGSVDVVKMAATIAALEAKLARLKASRSRL